MRRLAATTSLAMIVAAMARADGVDVAIPAQIKPLLTTHCVGCHEGARAKGDVDLVKALRDERVDESVLRALRRRMAKRDMPPATETDRPSDDEYRAAIAAIDAVCAPLSREVPAVRRLNRAQYAGAVVDVLGCSADSVIELLPRDDIGEGFDTTASTLGLPPLLVEKYFDAAERIADDCVAPASWTQRRVISPEKLERNGQGGTYDGIAWLATVGTLTARFEVKHAGRYRVTLEAAGQFAGDENPRLEATAGGRPIASIGVGASASAPQTVMGEVDLAVGAQAVVARFTNDFWNPNEPDVKRRDRNLGIGQITIEGPLGPAADTLFELRAREIAGVDHGDDGVTQLRRVAEVVGCEMFRRALEKGESDALVSVAREAAGAQAAFDEQLRALVTVLLVDPRFLLRIERGTANAKAARHPLTADELASRIAFFLWSSVPDAQLRAAASAGELTDETGLRAQILRMLADPRAASLSRRFATQWLGIDGLEFKQVDPKLYPAIDTALLLSMRRETELLFDEVVRGGRPVRALIESRTTRVDARLAAHYGMAAHSDMPAQASILESDAWVERAIATQRGSGVLGHASVLLATSNPTRTSPVKRGKWVLQALLDDAPPPPPPGVAQLPETAEARHGLTIRELMAQHRTNPDCASCHVRMDAIGLAFEGSDVDGRLRADADDISKLPDGSELRGVAGIADVLAKNRAFERSLARQVLVYALGRGTADADDPLIDALANRLAERGDFSALVDGIVLSDAFRTRVDR